MTHEHYRELVAGQALYSLEPADEQELLAHLGSCGPCTRELVAAQDVLAQLAYAAPQVDPPADLFARIRSGVLASDPDAFDEPATVVPIGRARSRRLQTRAAKLVVAAASVSILALGALGAWNLSLRQDNAQRGQVSAAAQAALSALEAQPGQTVPLTAPDGTVDALAVVNDDRASVVVEGLAPNDRSTSTYVLWGQVQGQTFAMAKFDVEGGRVGVVRDVATRSGSTPLRLMITKEPGRGLPSQPSGLVLAEGVTRTA